MVKKIFTAKINEETGEIFEERERMINSKVWKEGKGAILNPRNHHKKIYSNVRLSEVIKNREDLFKTYLLTEHIYKDTNTIYFQKSKSVFKPADAIDIAKILNIKEETAKKYLSRMIKAGIIAKLIVEIKDEKYISYVFNPVYVNSSKYISNTIYLLFKPYLDKYFPEWVKEQYRLLNENEEKETEVEEFFENLEFDYTE